MREDFALNGRLLAAAFIVVVILAAVAGALITLGVTAAPVRGVTAEAGADEPVIAAVAASPAETAASAAAAKGAGVAEAEAAPAPAMAAAPQGAFTADFGAFGTADEAAAMATALRARGIPAATVSRPDGGGRVWHHAVSGSYASRGEAAVSAAAFALTLSLWSAPLALRGDEQ